LRFGGVFVGEDRGVAVPVDAGEFHGKKLARLCLRSKVFFTAETRSRREKR
jgi:hypothetical protein